MSAIVEKQSISRKPRHGHNGTKFRKLVGLSQKEVGDIMGLNQRRVSELEDLEEWDEEIINSYAAAIGVKPQLIKEYSDEAISNLTLVDTLTIDATAGDLKKQVHIGNNGYNTNNFVNDTEFVVGLMDKIRADEKEKYAVQEEKEKRYYDLKLSIMQKEIEALKKENEELRKKIEK